MQELQLRGSGQKLRLEGCEEVFNELERIAKTCENYHVNELPSERLCFLGFTFSKRFRH